MTVAWAPRLTGGSLSWASLTGNVGVINGSADVLDSVERDQLLLWQVHGGVTASLSLLWQVNADPITAVESDLSLTWNVIVAAGPSVERDLELLWQRGGSVTTSLDLLWQVAGQLDVAGAAPQRRALKHPGWERKQAMDQLARERAMERSIREALNPTQEQPPALVVPSVPQRTAAQVVAEMAAYDRVRVTRERADLAEREARRARMDISRLRAELPARRRAASMRAIEQMLGKL